MIQDLVKQVSQVVLGKDYEVRLALTCLLAKGHLLIEDIPGIGKTTLAKTLSQTLGLDFKRIQCTSDMLPGDILGVSVFDQNSGSFNFHEGPVFTQVLLADEVNRTTPKTQSALLEAMEELQVTVEGETKILEAPFFVIATQNPMEQSGTYRLPESQLDRFLMRINLGYPNREAEKHILRNGQGHQSFIEPLVSTESLLEMQTSIENIHVSDALLEYVQDLLELSRDSHHFQIGLSPRAGKALVNAARAWAFTQERGHVLPEDIQEMLPHVAAHRLHSIESRQELSKEQLREFFSQIPVPK
jgi:MoxR-like ATPase